MELAWCDRIEREGNFTPEKPEGAFSCFYHLGGASAKRESASATLAPAFGEGEALADIEFPITSAAVATGLDRLNVAEVDFFVH